MVRGKNSSGVQGESADKADTFNLLDSTDSDTEWLSLPPLKSKKLKRKKGIKAQRETGCSFWGMLKALLALCVLGAIVLLCVISVWLSSQLTDINEQLRQLEGRSRASTDDVERLFQQMAAVNKSVDQRSKMLDRVISNMSTINSTVWQLSLKVDKLSEGLKAAPELKQLPDKLQTVSQSLAALGSDVSGMKDIVDTVSPFMKSTNEKLNALTSQIQAINNTQVPGEKPSSDSGNIKPELANVIEGLSQHIQEVNSTVATRISVLIRSNSQHEDRLTRLENATRVLMSNLPSMSSDHTSIPSEPASHTDDDYTSDEFKSSVSDIVQDLLINEGPIPSSADVQAVMANITKALDSLTQMENKYKEMEQKSELEPVSGDEYVSLDMFQTLGDGFETKIENLNATFMNLKSDVSTMSHILITQSNAITNLTHQMDGTRTYLATLQTKLEHAAASTNSKTQPSTAGTVKLQTELPVTDKPTEPPAAGKPTEPHVTENSTEKMTTGTAPEKLDTVKIITRKPVTKPTATKLTEETQQTKTQTGPPTEKPGTSIQTHGTFDVDWIKTPAELKLNFQRWDIGGSGQVNYNIITDHLGSFTPDEHDLEQFDADGNGLYSLEEIAKAFGITLPTTTAERTTKSTQPPR